MRNIKWQVATVAVLALGLVLTPVANASFLPTKVKTAKPATPAQNHGELLTALHQAKTLLDTAIHDYDGHRAKAVGEVHHAIHELSQHHKGTAPKAAATATTTPVETQAQSDMQLKQALQILSEVGGNIPKTHKAVGHVQTAIEELNVALKIK